MVQAGTPSRVDDVGYQSEQTSVSQAEIAHLYAQYENQISAYAHRRSPEADASDVVAETFLTAWRKRDDIPAEPKTLPWLYGVCRRVLANQRRSERRRHRLFDRLAQEPSSCESPVHLVEVAASFGDVASAVNALPENDAELLRLTAWEGLGPSEIADSLGIEPTAARQRLFRARQRLNAEIERRAEADARRTRFERIAIVILVLAVVLGAIIMSGMLGASVELETDLINDGESGARQVVDRTGGDELPDIIINGGNLPDAPVANAGVAAVDQSDGAGAVAALEEGDGADVVAPQPDAAAAEPPSQLGSNEPEAPVVDASQAPAQQITQQSAETVVSVTDAPPNQPAPVVAESPAVVLIPGETEAPVVAAPVADEDGDESPAAEATQDVFATPPAEQVASPVVESNPEVEAPEPDAAAADTAELPFDPDIDEVQTAEEDPVERDVDEEEALEEELLEEDLPATSGEPTGPFSKGEDLFVFQLDFADTDDGQAAVATAELASYFGVDPVVVAGTYALDNGRFTHEYANVLNATWGNRWLNAQDDRPAAVDQMATSWISTLDQGGHVWVAEGGASDFTAEVLREVQDRRPELNTDGLVHVVHHSQSNLDRTLADERTFVEANTDLIKIDDGNGPNGTAGLNEATPGFEEAALGGEFSAGWQAAFETRPASELDFSDAVTALYLLGVDTERVGTPADFQAEFLR